ncbi:hypothetical protein RAE19_19075 [Rhodoferax sp. TBRC 17660]|uniref:Uncharacterized protein n=1 Tax=Rhodoferax potami TaxID=3068338 RepID=A0ABU3KTG8_9BURK|nr:hypothetical protein [Rhodoferax sp. TBRC 17660]MDT7520746.1 hypothetical protein [Rhodoferax sp. TBRC 17660]
MIRFTLSKIVDGTTWEGTTWEGTTWGGTTWGGTTWESNLPGLNLRELGKNSLAFFAPENGSGSFLMSETFLKFISSFPGSSGISLLTGRNSTADRGLGITLIVEHGKYVLGLIERGMNCPLIRH